MCILRIAERGTQWSFAENVPRKVTLRRSDAIYSVVEIWVEGHRWDRHRGLTLDTIVCTPEELAFRAIAAHRTLECCIRGIGVKGCMSGVKTVFMRRDIGEFLESVIAMLGLDEKAQC